MFKILSFIAGITTLCFSDTLFFASNFLYCFALALALLLSQILIQHQFLVIKNAYLKKVLQNFLTGSFLFLLAMLYAQSIAQSQLNSRLSESLDGSDIQITGTVVGLVEQRPLDSYRQQNFYQRFLFKINTLDDNSSSLVVNNNKQPKIIQINNYQYLPIKSGQQWQFNVRLKRPRGYSNPGSFDYPRYLLMQRIDATAYIRSASDAKLMSNGSTSWFTGVRASRVHALQAPLQNMTNPGLLKALLLGDRSHLSANNRLLLQRTGTSHLLAISGLHIGVSALFAAVIAKIILWLIPSLMHYWSRALIIACTALPIASFYAIVAGLSLSTRRALIMLACFLVMMLLRRHSHMLQTLTLAALVIVIIDPLSVLSAGFWFSFSAVAILLWFSRSIGFYRRHISRSNQDPIALIPRIIISGKEKFILFCLAQIAIFIAMPLVLSLFTGQGSLITPIANLVAIPLVSLTVVPAGIAGLLVSYFSPSIAQWFLTIADYCLSWIIVLLQTLDDFSSKLRLGVFPLDLHSYQIPLSSAIFVIAFVSIVILLGRRAIPGYAAAIVIWLVVFNPFGFSLKPVNPQLSDNDLVLTQLDVGQGSAILLSAGDYHLLYDTGPKFSSSSNAANRIIEPYLATMRIPQLDLVVVSHGDNDHSGGMRYLNEYSHVSAWLLGGSAAIDITSHSVNYSLQEPRLNQRCRAGQQWQQGRFSFEILYPAIASTAISNAGFSSATSLHGTSNYQLTNDNNQLTSENDQSCVLSVKVTGAEKALVLLTGDISRRVEQQLASINRTKLTSDILLVPHHGSASSSSPALLAAVQPQLALISAGHRNRYKHPHNTVLERYSSRDISVYRSDQLGAIQFIYRNNQWLGPYCAKYIARHFWQDFDSRDQCIGPLYQAG